MTSLTGHELGRERFPSPREESCPPQSPQKRERCPQNFFDPVLRRFAQMGSTVRLAYQTELLGFDESAEAVVATVRNAADGQTRQVRSQYLVGCDGGGSLVRRLLGIEMQGEPNLTFTTNAVFRCRTSSPCTTKILPIASFLSARKARGPPSSQSMDATSGASPWWGTKPARHTHMRPSGRQSFAPWAASSNSNYSPSSPGSAGSW